ncbi:MAG: CaiB/BaiF CoA-transferase family protein [Dehalococcoidia bacterium]|jgi:crotonobetainyl-CoA:carnitine CoA-transferase CaiB-like acyl-CoA transferase
METTKLALDGIKILNMCWIGPGAFCTEMLSDLGADVIRISDVNQGDHGALAMMVFDQWPGLRNCRTFGVNLKTKAGKEAFMDLVKSADVMMEGFRPGVVKRLGIDYDALKKINPRIVYVSLSGYGQDGPYRDLVGHELNYIAISGLLGLTGSKGEKPSIPGTVVADWSGGMSAGISILSALLARERSGNGQFLDVSITDAITEVTSVQINPYLYKHGIVPQRGETIWNGKYPWYSVYETKDKKYVAIATLEPKFFATLCKLLGCEEFVPYQFDEGAKRDEMFEFFKVKFQSKNRDEWVDLLMYEETCFAPVLGIDEVESDPQLIARRMILESEHPVVGHLKQIGSMHKLSDSPVEVRNWATSFGQHTDEILREIGYSAHRIKELREAGAVG